MLQALNLGEKVKGKTGNNPWVGCVIVKNNQVLGRGATQPPGGKHAEAEAISEALNQGHTLEGSTLYCTVEPCSFRGRTPSCAKAIAQSGIQVVEVSIRDPHPKVNGKGIRILIEAGIKVNEGLCSQQVKNSLKEWLHNYIS